MTTNLNEHKDFIIVEYVENKKSTYEISKSLNTYPNKIRRVLVKSGVQLRDKSEAQSVAIESGRHKHPTKGKNRSEAEKIKISEGMFGHWEQMEDDEREKRSVIAKKQWQNMSVEERENLRRAAAEAVRKAAKEGSKIEKFLQKSLTQRGYNVIFHKSGLVANQRFEIDLFLPNLKIAIEVDGPSHFIPIWGEKNLQKRIKADAQKSGLLLQAGYVILRIKHVTKNLSAKRKRDLFEKILVLLKQIEGKFPPKTQRFIELEV